MADGTPIEWTDATVNVVNGCSGLSPGCTNCYAMRAGGRNLPGHPSTGLTQPSKAGHVWTGEVRFNEKALLQPLRWRRPRRIFWNAHGDLFHDSVPDAWIDRCFAVMALTPQHSHQVLTKRSARMRAWFHRYDGAHDDNCADMVGKAFELRSPTFPAVRVAQHLLAHWPLPNVWLGVSVEDQTRADERIPDLLATPAAVKFLSCEPLLGSIDLSRCLQKARSSIEYFQMVGQLAVGTSERLQWVIAGGESGAGARPMHPDWARSLRDQCAAAGVPFLFKQWGEWTPGENVDRQSGWVRSAHWFDDRWVFEDQDLSRTDGHCDDEPDLYCVGKRAAGRRLDGATHDGMPA